MTNKMKQNGHEKLSVKPSLSLSKIILLKLLFIPTALSPEEFISSV